MIDYSSKFLFGLIVVSVSSISFQLIPLSKQASSWNRCLKNTSTTLNQFKAVQMMDDQAKEVVSVMICNGAVFEPKIKN